MKVYLDCSPLTNTQVSGIGVYNKNLFLELQKVQGDDVVPVLKWSRFSKAQIVESHIKTKVAPLAPLLFNKNIVYHGTDHKLNTRSLGPRVVTIHDMQPFVGKWIDPKFAEGRIEIMSKVLNSSVEKIIAISHFTKQEIIKYFPRTADRIEVVYHGHQFKKFTIDSVADNSIKNLAAGRPFLFFIGNIEERKNLINQIKAFEILKKENPDLIFILSGKEGFNAKSVIDAIAISPYKADIYLTGYLSDNEKEYAMKETSCFMFASWYEGFGLPLIEALSTNTNIVISNTSSLQEIGASFCHQCNPADPDDIAHKVALVMKNGNLKRVDESFHKEWSWQKCALETMSVYQKA